MVKTFGRRTAVRTHRGVLMMLGLVLAFAAGCRGAGNPGATSQRDHDAVPPHAELGAATYRAQRAGDTLLISAEGNDSSPGYANRLVSSKADGPVPEFVFYWWLLHPDRPTIQVLTPFSIQARFRMPQRLELVKVRDRDGRHQVLVEPSQ